MLDDNGEAQLLQSFYRFRSGRYTALVRQDLFGDSNNKRRLLTHTEMVGRSRMIACNTADGSIIQVGT